MERFSPFSSNVSLPVPPALPSQKRRDLPKLSLIGLGEPTPSMAPSPLRAPREVLCSLLVEKFVLNGNHPYLGAPNRQIGQAALQSLEMFAEEYRKKMVYYPKGKPSMTIIQRIFAKMRPH